MDSPSAFLIQFALTRPFSSLFLVRVIEITRPDIHLRHLLYQGLIRLALHPILDDLCRRLSLGQPAGLETDLGVALRLSHAQSPDDKARREDLHFGKSIYVTRLLFQAACISAGSLKSACFLSTASIYATSLLATASVALFRLPDVNEIADAVVISDVFAPLIFVSLSAIGLALLFGGILGVSVFVLGYISLKYTPKTVGC